MICADTSFLISFYGDDVNSEQARMLMVSIESLSVHVISEFEFANALRLLVFRGKIDSSMSDRCLADYKADKARGVIIFESAELTQVFENAETISADHTELSGNRAYDILQVAAAKMLGATDFWSFDGKQRQLAKTEGLNVWP